MGNNYQEFIRGLSFTSDLKTNVELFLNFHDENETFIHTSKVAKEALRLAGLFGVDSKLAEHVALLHDISNVIPKSEMLKIAMNANIPVLDEEHRYPRIVHQKLSKDMAKKIFSCHEDEVLNAIECHTTLKAGASTLDKVLFVADKISWELPGEQPYQGIMRYSLGQLQLDEAVLTYLNFTWEQRNRLKLVHPWLIEAREELLAGVKDHG